MKKWRRGSIDIKKFIFKSRLRIREYTMEKFAKQKPWIWSPWNNQNRAEVEWRKGFYISRDGLPDGKKVCEEFTEYKKGKSMGAYIVWSKRERDKNTIMRKGLIMVLPTLLMVVSWRKKESANMENTRFPRKNDCICNLVIILLHEWKSINKNMARKCFPFSTFKFEVFVPIFIFDHLHYFQRIFCSCPYGIRQIFLAFNASHNHQTW